MTRTDCGHSESILLLMGRVRPLVAARRSMWGHRPRAATPADGRPMATLRDGRFWPRAASAVLTVDPTTLGDAFLALEPKSSRQNGSE